jgi:ketosteroid isomerase-like protein
VLRAARFTYLLTVLAAVACSGAPGAEGVDRATLRTGVDSAANRLLTALRGNASDSLMVLMADDVVLMPPNEAVLKGKAAVRAWYDQFLTQLRTTELTITGREVLIGGEWATELAAFSWTLVPVAGGRQSPTGAATCRSGTVSQMDDGSSPANCGTALPRL